MKPVSVGGICPLNDTCNHLPKEKIMHHLYCILIGICSLFWAPLSATAGVALRDAFDACEASVVQNTIAPMLELGEVIGQNERGQRIRIDTVAGTLLADVSPTRDNVARCILWGKHPTLEAEFTNDWQDWAEWGEVEEAAQAWYDVSKNVAGNVDLTDTRQPGFVVARCNVRKDGIVLAVQPVRTGAIRQVYPKLDPPPKPRVFFQFSVMRALPGRCQAAVEAFSDR